MTIKEAKKNFILDVAEDLFFEKSIADVTIRDIAQKAGIGEATVYRYFAHKSNIVVSVAEKLQSKVYTEYFGNVSGENGYAKIETFFKSYLEIFKEHSAFFRFVSEFDAFMLSENRLSSEKYSYGIDLFKNVFISAYRDGVKDNSVREIKNPETFYFSSTHALLELCKKLSANASIVKQDETTDKVAEIEGLIETILYFLASSQA